MSLELNGQKYDVPEMREALRAGLAALSWMVEGIGDQCRELEFGRLLAANPGGVEVFDRMLARDVPFLRAVLTKVDRLMQDVGDHLNNGEVSDLDMAMTAPAFRAVLDARRHNPGTDDAPPP
jgi:hypothetical protein